MQDCATYFQNHTGTPAVPHIELDVNDEEAARHRATGILIMYPKVEVTSHDAHLRYPTTLAVAD